MGRRSHLGGERGALPGKAAAFGHGLEALLTLRLLPGVGDLVAARLLAEAGSRDAALDRVRRGGPGVPRAAREALHANASGARAQARGILNLCARQGIGIVGVDDESFPEVLGHLHSPPTLLFLRGRVELMGRPAVAIVGSRRSTPGGRRVAERLGRELARAGWTVVSGMAVGIDAAAHRGALAEPEGGGTVAVLGRGPDRAYPLSHAHLFHQVAGEGLLLSEFPPGVPARAHNFPRRNRILAALAAGVVVVEAEEKSGALLTAGHALDLGREVMVVPGSTETPSTRGSNGLLQQGATPVTSTQDVLDVLASGVFPFGGLGPGSRLLGAAAPRAGADLWAEERGEVLAALSLQDPLPLDLLLLRTPLPPSRVLGALTRLELLGLARREPEGWIRLADDVEVPVG